ncbi:MAG: hypothetical protein IT429_15820 [Gemmataceae bacterium]|nr:hypothetical protein [Gemmataceae bacterium]
MELLCPSCQHKLTIPDQFAGQPAKCPLCENTFTAPTLPSMPAAYTPPPDPPAPAPAVASTLAAASVPVPAAEAPPAPALTPPPADAPALAVAQPAAPEPASLPAEYRHCGSMHVRPGFWRWTAVAAAFFVFVLSFFPWVGVYPGGVPARTATAWQAAFGTQSIDEEVQKLDVVEKHYPLAAPPRGRTREEGPGMSGFTILYVLLLIPMVAIVVGVAFWDFVPLNLPARVQGLRPWRWGIAGAVALLGLLFLVLQGFTDFGLEAQAQARADSFLEAQPELKDATTPAKIKEATVVRGWFLSPVQRTGFLTWATRLHGLVVVGAFVMFWLERRATKAKPLPRLDLLW